MAFSRQVFRWERVVPVRFIRAPDPNDPSVFSGPFDPDAPDLDDRGFVAWTGRGASHTAGSAVLPVGLDQAVDFDSRPQTRVRLVRQEIGDGAPLFLTTESSGVVSVVQPATAALPVGHFVMIKLKAQAAGSTHLEVRFGSDSGPVIHRLEVIVSPMIDLRLTAHVPTVNGAPINDVQGNPLPAASPRNDQNIFDFINQTNRIYFPYGIRLVPDATIDRAGVLNLAHRGAVDDVTEFNTTTALNRVAHSLNAYFVPAIVELTGAPPHINPGGIGGVGLNLVTSPNNFGLLIADRVTDFIHGGTTTNPVLAQSVAHEVGHVLNLIDDPSGQFVHVNRKVNAGTGQEQDVRDDLVSRRRLLYAYTDIAADGSHPYRDDVGYGNLTPGGMLSVKQLNNDLTDMETASARSAAAKL